MGDVFGNGKVSYTGDTTDFPTAPSLQSPIGPDGKLLPQFQAGYNGPTPQVNMNPLSNLEAFASGTGDSPWATAQLQALKQASGQAMGNAQMGAASAGTQAADAAGARGGLSTGAAQNLARNSANNATMAGQNVWGQMLQGQNQIRSNDAQNRLNAMENLPGQEVQAVQPALQEQSLQQQLGEFNANMGVSGLNQTNQNALQAYQNQIMQQAGKEMAGAQANSGKK